MVESAEPLAGEPADTAIPALVEQHGALLYNLGRRFCGSEDEAQDLVQDVFLIAWKNWDRFDGRAKAKTWLYTIAARACQRRHRKRAGEPEHIASFEELLPGRAGTTPDLRADGDEAFERQVRRETAEAVDHAISQLPVHFRMALVLKDIVGLSIADIAQILDVKEATVKTRIHRARLLLRKELSERFPDRPSPRAGQPAGVCLDLLRTKLDALDRGIEFALEDPELCERCNVVFHQLDLTKDACEALAKERLPKAVAASLAHELESLAS